MQAGSEENHNMEHSLFLAKLMGVVLIVGPIVKTVRHKQFVIACARAYESPTAIFVIGGLVFICSTALLLSHAVWVADWRIVVTLLGWLMLSVSLLQLFFPRSMAWPMRVLPEARYRIILDVSQALLGAYLLYHGFYG
jgi:hypothetical protein